MTFHISEVCFEWCKEAHFAHQNNIQIYDLSLVALALFSLLINHTINSHADLIMEKTKLTENQLEKIYIGSSYFAFILLAIFLIYVIGFK